MEVSHFSKSDQGDDGLIVIPLTQRTAKNMNPSPSTARAPVDPLPEVAILPDDSVAALAASTIKPSRTGLSPQDVSPPPRVGSSPSSMNDGDESDPEHSELASTVRLVGHDLEVGLTSQSKSDEDDYVLARTASGSDMEVAESIG